MKISLSILTLSVLLCVSSTFAQQNRENRRETDERSKYARKEPFGIGLSLGLHQFTGDVQDLDGGYFEGAENSLLFGGNILAKYRIGALKDVGSFHLTGRAGYHPMDGKLNDGEDVYEFTNNAILVSLGLQFELMPQYDIRPYANVGIGFLAHDPKVTTAGRWINRYTSEYVGEGKATAAIPVDIGIMFTVSRSIDLMINANKTLALSDNLDGWESNINDNWQSFNLGFVYYFGSDEKRVVEETPPPPPVKKDTDGDGLLDEDETAIHKTDPNNKDTDGDGLMDGDEVKTYKTNPLNPDTDGEGLKDGEEVLSHKTDPLIKDTDGDGCNDFEEVKTMKTKPLTKDTDGDGLNDCEEVNRYKTNPLVVDTDKDGANDGREVAAGTNPLVADVLNVESGKDIVLEGINFETAKATILPTSEPILMKAYNTMKVNDKLRVEIQGHTDDRGSDASNQKLSEARANSVKAWLVQRGIDANRMTTIGLGETKPMVPNTTPENRAQNRRIQFKILK